MIRLSAGLPAAGPRPRGARRRPRRRPEEQDDLARVALCQPGTEILTPWPCPVYQPVKADTTSTTPARSPIRSPIPIRPALEERLALNFTVLEACRHRMEYRADRAAIYTSLWRSSTNQLRHEAPVPARRSRCRPRDGAPPPGASQGPDRTAQAHEAGRHQLLARARCRSSRASCCASRSGTRWRGSSASEPAASLRPCRAQLSSV